MGRALLEGLLGSFASYDDEAIARALKLLSVWLEEGGGHLPSRKSTMTKSDTTGR